mmetsp:Transcript_7215/g.19747  ORF Transcript_7215/g.19747 Transcript_7215/m.19747 type:complete len:294 (+) Transcript_7215:85-966(+)
MHVAVEMAITRDRTAEFRNLLVQHSVDELGVRASQILRPARSAKGEFTKAVDGVGSLLAALRKVLAESRAGDLDTQLEAQITEYIHRCKLSIDTVQNLCASGTGVGANQGRKISPMEQAHRQGCVLILAERLKGCMATFEAMQRARAARIEQAELSKRRRRPALKISPSMDYSLPRNTQTSPSSPRSAQQQSLQSENYALQQELSSLTDQAQHAERTVREIASLNQAFSTALFHQAEQIEVLYNQAVEASNHMDMGNVQLKKTVRTNGKSSKWMFIIMVVFSLMLLFFDWWYG